MSRQDVHALLPENISYDAMLRGEHPDMQRFAENKSQEQIANRSIMLHLRDIFVPLCNNFAEKIIAVPPAQITAIIKSAIVNRAIYTDEIFNDQLAPFIENGTKLPAMNEWREFLQCYEKLSAKGSNYFRSLLMHTRDVATLQRYGMDKIVSGRYHGYFWCPTGKFAETTSHAVDTTVVPIGEYGAECALRMLLTTNILINLSEQLFVDLATQVEKRFWEVLSQETARGQAKKDALAKLANLNDSSENDLHHYQREAGRISILDSFKEALQSVQACLSSLMAQKILDIADYEIYLQEVIAGKLPIQFAHMVPFGYTLPVVRRGRYFPNTVEIAAAKKQRRLNFSRIFAQTMREFKQQYISTRVFADGQRNPGLLGNGCPASMWKHGFDKSGTGFVLDAYQHVFAIIGKPPCRDLLHKHLQ